MTLSDSSLDSEEFLSASSDTSYRSVPSLAESLSSHFSDVTKNFNVVHINAQSIPAHFPDILASFDCMHIHAILVSESWLKPCLLSSTFSLPGFQLVRNDRSAGGGGGVAIYIKSNIPFTIVSLSPQPPPSNAGEHLFIEVELAYSKLLLGVFYCPSSHIDYFSSLEIILEDVVPSYSQTIIMGDFNTCLLKNDYRSSSLKSVIQSNNLSILPLSATHHFPNCTPSLLDLIFVSSLNHVAKHGQCSADAFSYHDLLFLSYRLRSPKPTPKILVRRNFREVDLSELSRDAGSIDWSPLLISDNINEKVNIFTSNLIKLFDTHAPLRQVKIKHLPSPWLTPEIKALLVKKARAKSKFKSRPTDSNRQKYVEIRNYCNKVCRKAQRQHIHSSVENGDPAKVWKFLKSLGIGTSRQVSVSKNLSIDALNQYFSSPSLIDGTAKFNTLHYLSSIATPDCPPFIFSQFTNCDVKKSIMSIASNAVGSDSISRNMILPILDIILPILSHILNFSISCGVFPSTWKDAHVIPLPKKSNPITFQDYRPISVLPFLSKVLERLIHTQINNFLSKHSLLDPLQSGFRPGHSTTTALVHITDDIRLGMENSMLTILTLIDFSNAFNTVDFDVLLSILCSLNISPMVIDWFRSYLSGRRQRIYVDDTSSSWCCTAAGVPQGGVLSPLLFAIFINSITNNLRCSYHLYADDLQIYTHVPLDKLDEGISNINKDLDHICKWSKSYGLKINPCKTQAIIVGSSRLVSRVNWSLIPQVYCEGVNLPFSDKVVSIGICIDRHLSWGPQLQEVSRKIFASAGSLRRLRNFLPITTKIALAQSLLLPILDYADASYLNLTEDQLNKLERLQNFCIRFIFGLRKYDHVSLFRTKLKWLPIRLRRNAHILSLLYKILFSPSTPVYLKRRFEYLHLSHSKSLRSSENLRLKMPPHTTKFMDKSFTIEAVRLWNDLPEAIRKSKSLTMFNKMVKDLYLKGT